MGGIELINRRKVLVAESLVQTNTFLSIKLHNKSFNNQRASGTHQKKDNIIVVCFQNRGKCLEYGLGSINHVSLVCMAGWLAGWLAGGCEISLATTIHLYLASHTVRTKLATLKLSVEPHDYPFTNQNISHIIITI